jgi:hypothetical protein
VDLANVHNILPGTGGGSNNATTPVSGISASSSTVGKRAPATSSVPEQIMHCFLLMDSSDNPILSLTCSSPTQYSEWTDGFNFLLGKAIANKDTAEFIQSLVDVELRIRLLDITAEKLELKTLEPPVLPSNIDFYYQDPLAISKAGI